MFCEVSEPEATRTIVTLGPLGNLSAGAQFVRRVRLLEQTLEGRIESPDQVS